jgi:hypothetical protein
MRSQDGNQEEAYVILHTLCDDILDVWLIPLPFLPSFTHFFYPFSQFDTSSDPFASGQAIILWVWNQTRQRAHHFDRVGLSALSPTFTHYYTNAKSITFLVWYYLQEEHQISNIISKYGRSDKYKETKYQISFPNMEGAARKIYVLIQFCNWDLRSWSQYGIVKLWSL